MATDLLVKLLWVSLLLQRSAGVFAVEKFLPPQRDTGLGCFREGEVVNYTCTVVDTDSGSGIVGSTRWTGTAFDCVNRSPQNAIHLFNADFATVQGASGDCNNGAIVARSVGVDGDEYTSVLTINVSSSFDGQTVSCGLQGESLIGNDTLQVGVVPGPPVNPGCNFTVPGETFTVSWSRPPGGMVGGAVYSVSTTGDCGSCTTSGLMTSCSGWTAMGQTCTFTVQTITLDCGFPSGMSEPETVVLIVPPRLVETPNATYSESGILLSITTNISESQFANLGEVCRNVSGAVTHFLLEYTSGGTSVSRQLDVTDCNDGVCRDVFTVTSDCPGESYTASVHAVNVVGPGPSSIMSYECIAVCDRLDPPTNGSVSFSGDNREGSLPPGTMASYSCNPGYELMGEEAQLCQNDGQWSGEPPVCNCNTSILMPLATVNNARRVSHDCISAEYSVQTGYCPSTFIAMYDLSRSDWKYPSTSICTGTAVGITFVLAFIFSLTLGIIIGVISVLLCIKFRRKQPHDSGIELRDTPAYVGIYEEPEVVKKRPEDIETSGNVAYGPVHTKR